MTPIQQIRAYLNGEDPSVDGDIMLIIGMIIALESDHLLTEIRTKEQRRAELARLPNDVRETVQRQMISDYDAMKKGGNHV